MGKLRIDPKSACEISPKFIELYHALAELPGQDILNIVRVEVFLESDGAETDIEERDIQNMALFMLQSGSIVGVKWGEFYYFGDVDRMDSEFGFDPNDDDVTILTYLEDEDGEEG